MIKMSLGLYYARYIYFLFISDVSITVALNDGLLGAAKATLARIWLLAD